MLSCITGSSNNTFKYGADGLRRQKTTNGISTDYSYDSAMMVREGHASNGTFTPTITYLNGARGPEYRRDDTQTEIDSQGRTVTKTRWYVYDGLGSVVGELDPLGNLTSSPKYDVYGNVRSNGGIASTKHGFVGSLGHLSEAETGLIYMRARYMDPAVGRFVSQDLAGQGENWFTYCSNNPVNSVDENGNDWGLVVKELCEWFYNNIAPGIIKTPEFQTMFFKTVTRLQEQLRSIITKIFGGAEQMEAGEDQDVAGNELNGEAEEAAGGVSMISSVEELKSLLEGQAVLDLLYSDIQDYMDGL